MEPVARKKAIKQIKTEHKRSLPVRGEVLLLPKKYIPQEYLVLDPTNQRIQYLLKSEKISSNDEQAIEERMWKEEYVKDLSQSIELNGGLLEPLLVTADGIVLEGNSRLVALRRLKKRMEKKGHDIPMGVQRPPCEVLPGNISRTDLLWLLAEIHIAGKHPWDPYEQAETIYKLHILEGQPLDRLAQHLRMKIKDVERKLAAYNLMKEYLDIHRGKGQIDKWSYFDEVYKKPGLINRLTEGNEDFDPEFKEDLFYWINKNKLKGAEIRRLEPILEVPRARRILKRKGFKAAVTYLETVNPEFGSLFLKNVAKLIDQIDHLQKKDLQVLLSDSKAKTKSLRQIKKLNKKLKWVLDNFGEKQTTKGEVIGG